jgi:hypothetical protein
VAALRAALGPNAGLRHLARLRPAARPTAAQRLELKLLREQAPLAAIGTPALPEFFSARVGSKTFPTQSP